MAIVYAALACLREAVLMFWETLWALMLGFGLSGAVQAFASRRDLERTMGRLSPASVARATLFGMASSSCSYAASAMAKSLFSKGVDFTTAMIFMFASTNLVVELGIVLWSLLGWQFALSEFLGGFLMIVLFATAARHVLPARLIEGARRRVMNAALPSPNLVGDEATRGMPSLGTRIRSVAGWSDAARHALADITMLRREMVIGYGMAGALVVVIPSETWRVVFMNGHGFWTSLENAIIGPLIATISFVCSIGNVPLAAALWKGGISFGGVASFIFADLIAMPLILIYRKFYGWALTVRMVASFWAVMSVAGLAIEGIFTLIHAVPTTRPTEIVPSSLEWNHTTVLNLMAIGAFLAMAFLARRRQHGDAGAPYAIDPVCGMAVQTGNAPARTAIDGTKYYFCADRCRDRFVAEPQRFIRTATGR